MVAARRIIAVSVDADQHRTLVEISRSRTEPVNRVERAGIILAYLDEPSAYAVARAMGVSQQTVTRCLQRAAELGVLAALDDRARTGREARTGWSGWPAPGRRSSAIRTNCGRPVCWRRTPAITGRMPATRAWPTWPKERCARSWQHMR